MIILGFSGARPPEHLGYGHEHQVPCTSPVTEPPSPHSPLSGTPGPRRLEQS